MVQTLTSTTPHVSNDPAPPPTFDSLPLSPDVRQAVDDLGYTHPTPVQRAVFESAARGRDLVVQARTGTGKTAAFGLPIVDVLVKRSMPKVQALALCPTRELALQVSRELEALAKHRGLGIVPVYGGAPMPRQVELIRNGGQIVIGTPGRVLDHLERKTLDPSAIKVFVLDESDEMLSMGFLPQITQIMGHLPQVRQTLLFSATLPPDIRRMAETRLKNPEFITLSGDHIGALEINHFVYLTQGDKVKDLVQVIETENPEGAIVFCNTRDETKRVATALQQQGYSADWLNADLSQNEREKVMAQTRQGELRFLVATDVAARGIDISHLTHVINHDFPETAESYVHRTGRTGRAGRTGTAVSLIAPNNIGNLYILRLTYKIRPIEKQLPSAREKKTRAETDLVQLFVDMTEGRSIHHDDLSLARRLLTHEQADRIVASLLRDHLGARPDAAEEATAARRARAPAPPVAKEAPAPLPERRPRFDDRQAPMPERRPRFDDERGRRPRFDDRRPRGGSNGGRPADSGPERPRPEAPASADAPSASRSTESTSAESGRAESGRAESGRAESGRTESGRMESGRTESGRTESGRTESGRTEPGRTEPEAPTTEPRRFAEAEVYVNVGRRDGATPEELFELLERAGITRAETEYVRVRHRHAFVGVKKDLLERAVQAIDGATLASTGKIVAAEPARIKS
jgi:ATP-dependent RNA helicase DeaD